MLTHPLGGGLVRFKQCWLFRSKWSAREVWFIDLFCNDKVAHLRFSKNFSDLKKKTKKLEKKQFINNLKSDAQDKVFGFKFKNCDFKSETKLEWKFHERMFHMKWKSCKTDKSVMEDEKVQSDASWIHYQNTQINANITKLQESIFGFPPPHGYQYPFQLTGSFHGSRLSVC